MLNAHKVKFFCFLDQAHIDLHATLLSYRAQLAFFKICRTNGNEDMDWEEFVLLLRQWEDLRTATKAVIGHGVLHFDQKSFDFTIPQANFSCSDENSDCGTSLELAKLFTKQEGNDVVLKFMLLAELAHFTYLSRSKKPGYTWKTYLEEILKSDTLLESLSLAFQDGVRKIDFEPDWCSTEIAETKFLWSP